MRITGLIFIAFSAALLSGCSWDVPIATQWKLRAFDMGTADLTKLRFALRTPEWAAPTPDKTVLVTTFASEGEKDGERNVEIHLHRAAYAKDAEDIANLSQKTGPLDVYEIAPRDLATAQALQAEARKLKAEGRHGHNGVKVDRGLACRKANVPDGAIPIDVFIHPDDEIGWLPLLENYDVRALLKTPEDLRKFEEGAPLCDKHAQRASR